MPTLTALELAADADLTILPSPDPSEVRVWHRLIFVGSAADENLVATAACRYRLFGHRRARETIVRAAVQEEGYEYRPAMKPPAKARLVAKSQPAQQLR